MPTTTIAASVFDALRMYCNTFNRRLEKEMLPNLMVTKRRTDAGVTVTRGELGVVHFRRHNEFPRRSSSRRPFNGEPAHCTLQAIQIRNMFCALRSSARLFAQSLKASTSSPSTSMRRLHATARQYEQFLDATPETLSKAVKASKDNGNLVLVDFYADWCNPCKMLSPILEKITSDPSLRTGSGDAVDLVTVDLDSIPSELAATHNVRSIPTVLAFKNGEMVDGFIGAVPESGVRKFLDKL